MKICKLDAEMLVLTTLLEGQLERALGMASFAIVQTEDETAENYVQRIKDEALDRLVLEHKAQANVEEDARIEAMMASASKLEPNHPALMSKEAIAEVMEHDDDPRFDDDMGPDDRLQAERDAEDVADALSEPLGEAIVAAQKASGDDELIF